MATRHRIGDGNRTRIHGSRDRFPTVGRHRHLCARKLAQQNCRQKVEVEVGMHARVTSWEYRGPPPLLRIPPFSEELAAASTHGAPAETGPADDLAIIDEGALCYRRVGCPTVATLWPL